MIRKIVVGIGQIGVGLAAVALLFAVFGGVMMGAGWLVGGGIQAIHPGAFGTQDWDETLAVVVLALFGSVALVAILRGAYDAGGEILDTWRHRHYR